jgi:hypothetical protein
LRTHQIQLYGRSVVFISKEGGHQEGRRRVILVGGHNEQSNSFLVG